MVPDASDAVSPDGRRFANLTTEYFQTLHMGEESMTATVTVTDRETGERIYEGHFSYDVSRRGQVSGHEFDRVAFESDAVLLIGAADDAHVERVTLPAPGELSDLQVASRARAALIAAYGERAPALVDVIDGLFFRGDGYCRVCGPLHPQTATVYVCADCRGRFARRVALDAPPDIAMALAEASRAATAHASDPEQVIAGLSSRTAAIPSATRCTVCFKDPAPSPRDSWSAIGRACAGCTTAYVTR